MGKNRKSIFLKVVVEILLFPWNTYWQNPFPPGGVDFLKIYGLIFQSWEGHLSGEVP